MLDGLDGDYFYTNLDDYYDNKLDEINTTQGGAKTEDGTLYLKINEDDQHQKVLTNT